MISSASSKIYILPTILLSILWNIPRFNELYTCIQRENQTYKAHYFTAEEYSICPTPMRNDPHYIGGYILLANFFMMAFIPFFVLTITNCLIYSTISNMTSLNKKTSSRQKRDHNIAMILVGIVIVFSFCNIFRMIINLYEVSRNKKSVGKQLNKNTDPVFHLALSGDVSNKWPFSQY